MAIQDGDRVKFAYVSTYEDYQDIVNKDDATMYFVIDTKQVFLGSIPIATGPIVTQTASDTVNANHELLLSGSADNTTRTEDTRKSSKLSANPSTGNMAIGGQLTDVFGIQSSRVLTESQYIALPTAEKNNGTDYYITDADPSVDNTIWNKVGRETLDIGDNLTDGVNILSNIINAPAYSSDETYSLNSYCTYNDSLYKCTTAITVPEAWNSAHWTETTVTEELTETGDTKVTQTASTANQEFELLMSYTADNTSRTEGARKSQYAKFNPSTRNMTIGGILTDVNGVQSVRSISSADYAALSTEEKNNGVIYNIEDESSTSGQQAYYESVSETIVFYFGARYVAETETIIIE